MGSDTNRTGLAAARGSTERIRRFLRARSLGGKIEVRELDDGVVQLRTSTRWLRRIGLCSTAYLLDEVLIDTGFAHVRDLLLDALADRPIAAVACTHHHEDHTGNAGPIAARHRCPVYVRNASRLDEEGLRRLPAYRRFFWGRPSPFAAREMPEVIPTSRRLLRAVATPGHSTTHTVLFEVNAGLVFTGDLFVSSGASAVMRHEDPFEIVASLRRVAALAPQRMLTGHGLVVEQPTERLLSKAARIEEALALVLELHGRGLPAGEIRDRLFGARDHRDILQRAMTAGEFSTDNFVRASIARVGDRI